MNITDAVQTIASDIGLKPSDLEMVLTAVTKSSESQRRWIQLSRVANCNHSGTVTLNLNRGCITSTKTETSLDALDRTLSEGK